MNEKENIFHLLEEIANNSGVNSMSNKFTADVKSAINNNFSNENNNIPNWLLKVLTAITLKQAIPQTPFEQDASDGDVDNFFHEISDILSVDIEDEGELYSIDFLALSVQLIIFRMGNTYEVVNYA